jgi:DNA-binding IclR family transcriptional regulator
MSNVAQTRLLSVIETLSGSEVFGKRLKEIAADMQVIESKVLRDLQTMQEAGWAQQLPDGKWRLAARAMQVLNNFQYGLAEATDRVDEVRHNYSRRSA